MNNKYTARRNQNGTFQPAVQWGRNHNIVRHNTRVIGTTSFSIITGLLVLIVGLIYVSQGTKATGYDYELSAVESKISDLEAQKEDLAVERARLTSIAASEKSKVAMSMEEGRATGRAE